MSCWPSAFKIAPWLAAEGGFRAPV